MPGVGEAGGRSIGGKKDTDVLVFVILSTIKKQKKNKNETYNRELKCINMSLKIFLYCTSI